jgi:hypothetical protein
MAGVRVGSAGVGPVVAADLDREQFAEHELERGVVCVDDGVRRSRELARPVLQARPTVWV